MKQRSTTPVSKHSIRRVVIATIAALMVFTVPFSLARKVSADKYDDQINALQKEINEYQAKAGELNKQIHFGEGMQQWMQSMEDSAAEQIKFMLGRNTLSDLLLNIVFIAFFAGVGEELFFRGVLQRLFIKVTRNPWTGILISAAVFSAFHFQFFGFIPRFLLGAVLGAIYWYSGSLWPAMAAHFLYDAFFITLAYFYPQMIESDELPFMGQAGLMVGALVSAAMVAGLVWMMKKKSTVTYNEVYRDEDGDNKQKFTFED